MILNTTLLVAVEVVEFIGIGCGNVSAAGLNVKYAWISAPARHFVSFYKTAVEREGETFVLVFVWTTTRSWFLV